MTGIVEAGGLVLKGARVATWAVALFNRNAEERTRAMQEGYRDNVRHEWRLQRERLLEGRLAELEENEQNRQKLEELLTQEFFWILENYEFEAHREAIDERRRMLAFASAGSLNVELSLGEIARVERAIRELDPADVLLLARLRAIEDPPKPRIPEGLSHAPTEILGPWQKSCAEVAEARQKAALAQSGSGDALRSAGCTQLAPMRNTWGATFPTGLVVTTMGDWVLRVLDGYLRARQP
jgi:hypothetical protein